MIDFSPWSMSFILARGLVGLTGVEHGWLLPETELHGRHCSLQPTLLGGIVLSSSGTSSGMKSGSTSITFFITLPKLRGVPVGWGTERGVSGTLGGTLGGRSGDRPLAGGGVGAVAGSAKLEVRGGCAFISLLSGNASGGTGYGAV